MSPNDDIDRSTGPGHWIRYRGGLGMVMWALHRVTGLGVLLFLLLHVVDIFLLTFGPEVFNELLVIYTAPWARVMEVFLVFGVLFHALNGLRIAIQDFFPTAWLEETRLIALQLTVFVLTFVPSAWLILEKLFE
ncbi:MAG: succinate dehydrogenase, cytochrome b556 subunit [Gemmatimonadota bacterium]